MKKKVITLLLALGFITASTNTIKVKAMDTSIIKIDTALVSQNRETNINGLPKELNYLFKNYEGYNVIYKKYDDKDFNLKLREPYRSTIKNKYFNVAVQDYYHNIPSTPKSDYYTEKGNYIVGIETITRNGNTRYVYLRTKDNTTSDLDNYNSFDEGNNFFSSLTSFTGDEGELVSTYMMNLLNEMKEYANSPDDLVVYDIGKGLVVLNIQDGFTHRFFIEKYNEHKITIDKNDLNKEFKSKYVYGDFSVKQGKIDPQYNDVENNLPTESKDFNISEDLAKEINTQAKYYDSIEYANLEPFNGNLEDISEYVYESYERDGVRLNHEEQGKTLINIKDNTIGVGKAMGAFHYGLKLEPISGNAYKIINPKTGESRGTLIVLKNHILTLEDNFYIYKRIK